MLKDQERVRVLADMMDSEPYASTYKISDANLNFLMRKTDDCHKFKKENEQLKGTNRELESQIDRITMVILARQHKPILQRYHDIQAILGVDTFV